MVPFLLLNGGFFTYRDKYIYIQLAVQQKQQFEKRC
ncbi:hypothetical protein T11_5113 [Trichinella zimbabwensis]|uniref:Uncharacterized protein n=1 Tax=Trichinella zimbabwensis TaxID=268475 RepID=A0A0V1GRK4_9BILA|nr:hypothetical protein T11_5113 [Trichinella zimbabwensis]